MTAPRYHLIFSTLLLRAFSQVIYADPSDTCITEGPLLGNSVYCCSGICLDGTHIGDPGLCMNWLDLCGDVDTPPSCLYNQVLSYGDPPTVDSGDGCCGACCCECQYQRNNWSWNCCDCPLGFVAVDVGRCDATANPACVGCQEPDQVLHYDADTGYSCTISSSSSSSSTTTSTSTMSDTSATSSTATTPATTSDSTTQTQTTSNASTNSGTTSASDTQTQTTSDASTNSGTTSVSATQTTSQSNTASATTSAPTGKHTLTLCENLQSASDQMNKISSYSTWFGALCGTTDPLSAAVNYIEDGYAIAKAYYDRGTGGVFGNTFGAASSVLATISSFTIGAVIIANAPDEAAVASILELAYEGACAINTVAGIATTLEGREISQDLAKNNCPPAVSKRFLTSSNLLKGNVPRSQDYNPCAELLAFYPTDYSVPAKLKSVCDQVISDPTSLTLIPQVTETCQDYEKSGNSTILINFANMLQALQTFEPYCTRNSTLCTSSTSSSLKSQSVILSSKTSPKNYGSSTVLNYYGGSPSPSPYHSGSPSPNTPQQSYTPPSPPNNPPNPPYSPNPPNNPVPSSQNPQVLPTPSPYIAPSPSHSNEPANSSDAVGATPSPQSPYSIAATPSTSPSPAETPDISPSPAAPIPAAATSPNPISSGQVLASPVPTSPADTSAVSVGESETAAGFMSSGSSTLSSSNTSNGSTETLTYVPASSAAESSPFTMVFGTFVAGLAIVGVMVVGIWL